MAYSRWGKSRWYTYWMCPPEGTKENRDNAQFCVCPYLDFSALELRMDMDYLIEQAVALEEAECDSPNPVTEAERDELRGYMMDFLADVERLYQP